MLSTEGFLVILGAQYHPINIVDDLSLDQKLHSPSLVIYLLWAFTDAFCMRHPSFDSQCYFFFAQVTLHTGLEVPQCVKQPKLPSN